MAVFIGRKWFFIILCLRISRLEVCQDVASLIHTSDRGRRSWKPFSNFYSYKSSAHQIQILNFASSKIDLTIATESVHWLFPDARENQHSAMKRVILRLILFALTVPLLAEGKPKTKWNKWKNKWKKNKQRDGAKSNEIRVSSLNLCQDRSCCSESECIIPSGETWLLDASMNVGALIVRGKLMWDVNEDNLSLRFDRIFY